MNAAYGGIIQPVWHKDWHHNKCRSQWPIFLDPMRQCDAVIDFRLFFMVQWGGDFAMSKIILTSYTSGGNTFNFALSIQESSKVNLVQKLSNQWKVLETVTIKCLWSVRPPHLERVTGAFKITIATCTLLICSRLHKNISYMQQYCRNKSDCNTNDNNSDKNIIIIRIDCMLIDTCMHADQCMHASWLMQAYCLMHACMLIAACILLDACMWLMHACMLIDAGMYVDWCMIHASMLTDACMYVDWCMHVCWLIDAYMYVDWCNHTCSLMHAFMLMDACM